ERDALALETAPAGEVTVGTQLEGAPAADRTKPDPRSYDLRQRRGVGDRSRAGRAALVGDGQRAVELDGAEPRLSLIRGPQPHPLGQRFDHDAETDARLPPGHVDRGAPFPRRIDRHGREASRLA